MDRKIDGLGRIVIPKDIRNQLKIADNEYVDLSVENEAIVIKKKKVNAVDIRRITNVVINKQRVNERKEEYKPGDVVKLINMESEAYLIPRGMTGIVKGVDDTGSIHVKWENGLEIAVLDITGDSLEKVKK